MQAALDVQVVISSSSVHLLRFCIANNSWLLTADGRYVALPYSGRLAELQEAAYDARAVPRAVLDFRVPVSKVSRS